MRVTVDTAALERLQPELPLTPQRPAAWASGRILAAVALLAAAALVLASAIYAGRAVPTPAPFVAPQMPAAPVGGVLTLVIPPGAAADQQAGGRGYVMPDVIRLSAGDRIVLRNDDDAPHMILYAFLMPGESDERTFTEPGSEVYSSGCGVHAASFLNFTTIFVADRA